MENAPFNLEIEEVQTTLDIAECVDDFTEAVEYYFGQVHAIDHVNELRTVLVANIQDLKTKILFDMLQKAPSASTEDLSDMHTYLTSRYNIVARHVFHGCDGCGEVSKTNLPEEVAGARDSSTEQLHTAYSEYLDRLLRHVFAHLHAQIIQQQERP